MNNDAILKRLRVTLEPGGIEDEDLPDLLDETISLFRTLDHRLSNGGAVPEAWKEAWQKATTTRDSSACLDCKGAGHDAKGFTCKVCDGTGKF